jgi:choline kinase
MNILIPMGGIGHRFSKENYRFPKPLIKIVGRPMLFWLLDYLDTKEEDIIYIGVLEKLEKQFDLIQTLKVEYPNRTFQAIVLDFETRGAAETLFIMLQSIAEDRLGRKTISLDCDTIYFKPIVEEFRQLPDDLNASFFFEDNAGKPIYSYLKFNETKADERYNLISEVCEKIMVSSHANTGAYAFRSASVL